MTAPRRILPDRFAMITRRATQRQFLLRPDPLTNEIFDYCLAEAAKRHNVGLIAWIAMSNHYHAVVHDRQGQLPAFIEHLHKMLAKVLNVRWGRWENLWSTEETCITYLASPEDVFRKVVYVLSNPFADDVVDRLVDWPGSSSLPHLRGKRTIHGRPDLFFRANGVMPDSIELSIVLPPFVLESESEAQWTARVQAAIAKNEIAAREERLREGRPLLGRKAVLQASAFDSPSTVEPRRSLRPTLAAILREQRIAELRELVEFRTEYEHARLRFIQGERDVEFPAGTYRMRLLGARCAPLPLAA